MQNSVNILKPTELHGIVEMLPQKGYIHVLIPDTYESHPLGKSVFADIIKDLETRASWIIQVGPTLMNKCPYKRQAEGDLRHVQRENDNVKTESETGVIWPQSEEAKECQQPERVEEARKHPSIEPPGRAWPC